METNALTPLELAQRRLADHKALLKKMQRANQIIAINLNDKGQLQQRYAFDGLRELGYSVEDANELLAPGRATGEWGYSTAELTFVQEQIDQFAAHIRELSTQQES